MEASLVALGAALLLAGLLARFGQRLRLPTIPLFVIAGIAFGPHTPGISLVDSPDDLGLLATFGLVMLLFHLGLEFSVRDLLAGGRRLAMAGAVFLGLNVLAGAALGFAFGWGDREALVIAGAVAISSSAIVTKLLTELRRLGNRETPLILGVIVVEDVFLALYLAVVQPVLSDAGGTEIIVSIATAFAFLLGFALIARFASGLVRRLLDAESDELLIVCVVGLVVLAAGVAEEVGVSDAIAALLVGLVVAETGLTRRVEHLVLPIRDVFGAIFFFVFGVSIQPDLIVDILGPILIAVAVSLAVNLIAGLIVARRAELSRRAGFRVGLTVLARGEFSLILAALATAAGLDSRVSAFIAGYVLVLSLLAPVLATHADRLARGIRSSKTPNVIGTGGLA
jgi:monovalent cation:H+ antiporter-2, CPA2 family